MADHDQGPGELGERLLKLLHQHGRQVVGGLIDDQGAEATQEQAGQGKPALLPRPADRLPTGTWNSLVRNRPRRRRASAC